jgi:malic enzyme
VASAVAKTAFEEGVARVDNYDDVEYKKHLRAIAYDVSHDHLEESTEEI